MLHTLDSPGLLLKVVINSTFFYSYKYLDLDNILMNFKFSILKRFWKFRLDKKLK
jgi:hypothetical protein